MEQIAYSVPDVARKFGISDATAWRKVKSGEIKTIRFGSRRLVPAAEVNRLLVEGTQKVAA